ARLPYKTAADVERAETAILTLGSLPTNTTADRLGVSKALEALFRLHRSLRPPGPAAVHLLKSFVRQAGTRSGPELLRDARVRRLSPAGVRAADARREGE